jgi:type I restriction enzyme S subunit
MGGSAGQQRVQAEFFSRFRIPQIDPAEQSRIAAVLDTVDEAIAKTEAVIAKLKQVRAGLLHDLLTRGLDEHGQLRDPIAYPEQFKDSPFGRIPRHWELRRLNEIVLSAVDGPFGSNLKTEHYVSEPGVRVVRLQNVESGRFDDTDKAYVSDEHAANLQRHQVVGGDLLVASMGDENHPLARACLFPNDFQPGIVKADCFRLRMKPAMALNGFVMRVLNCPDTRRDVNMLGQGVTRDRVNLTTLLTVRVPRPRLTEQACIFDMARVLDDQIREEEREREKLVLLKSGLMTDLLIGRVRVPADPLGGTS